MSFCWRLLATATAITAVAFPLALLFLVGTGADASEQATSGRVESDHGESTAPGVHSGANYAGAEGPMRSSLAADGATGIPRVLAGLTLIALSSGIVGVFM